MRWANVVHCYQPPDWPAANIDRVVRECYRPFFAWLVDHPDVRLTVNLAGSLGEQLAAYGHDDVLDAIRTLLRRRQVTCTKTAMYHALLPLLPVDEAARQLTLQTQWFKTAFPEAEEPAGAFLPELAFSPALLPLLEKHGCRWMVLDEICANGALGVAATDRAFDVARAPLAVCYRNRTVSDYLFLFADLEKPESFWATVASDSRSADTLITAMDVENFGHHRPGLERLWQTLVTDPRVVACTLDEVAADRDGASEPIAGGWSSQEDELRAGIPFALWRHPENTVHRAQWALADAVVATVQRYAPSGRHPARRQLDRALASDQFWWASAEPWWDGTLIRRGADHLCGVLDALGVRQDERAAARTLRDAVRAAVEAWERAGIPAARRSAYLLRHESRHRLGGEVIEAIHHA